MTGAAPPLCSTDGSRFDKARQLLTQFVDHAIETQRTSGRSCADDGDGGKWFATERDASLEEGELTALEFDEAMDAAVAPSTSVLEALSCYQR